MLLWLGIVIFASKIINTKERFDKILDLLIFTATIVGVFGFVEEITHFNVFSMLNTVGSTLNYNPTRFGILRIISFTSHAISYCTYCMLILGILFYRISTSDTKHKRTLYVSGIIIGANAILTLSRISLLGILIEFVLFMYFSGKRQFLLKVAKYLVIVFAVIGLGCLVSVKFRHGVQMASYVVLALFDDSYISLLRANGFTDNAGGIGNRLDLYNWVFYELKGNFLLGRGASSSFNHAFINHDGYRQVKESIEVEWLRTLYRYGVIGLVGQIVLMLGIARKSYLDKLIDKDTISYGKMIFSIFVAYIIVFFGVMQNQDIQVFSIIVMLFLAYQQYSGFRVLQIRANKNLDKR